VTAGRRRMSVDRPAPTACFDPASVEALDEPVRRYLTSELDEAVVEGVSHEIGA
jgi:hypothetical protein